MSDSINLSISKEIVNPIVEAKIRDAIQEALGGKEAVITKVIDQVINTKVNHEGRVSQYSSDNKYSWIDSCFHQTISELVKAEINSIIKEQSSLIKDELIKQLKTKKGASQVAAALLGALSQTLESAWNSKVSIEINSKDKNG
jgi:hypothetical protein